LGYIAQRLLIMIPTLLAISIIVFVIIQAPPGDYLSSYVAELQSQGESVDPQKIQFLRAQYGLDQPLFKQYFVWLTDMLQGDFGYSFEYNLPVTKVVGDRLWLTFIVSFTTILFVWVVSFPICLYSATHQYSLGDYGLTFLGFLGQPWSWAKFGSVLQHLWIPVIVIGTAGTAGMIRRLRANLLDELHTQYV